MLLGFSFVMQMSVLKYRSSWEGFAPEARKLDLVGRGGGGEGGGKQCTILDQPRHLGRPQYVDVCSTMLL